MFILKSTLAQEVDYDDLYFDSEDVELELKAKPAKVEFVTATNRYVPSEHQEYDYYMEYQAVSVEDLLNIKLSPVFIIPMMVEVWDLYPIKNIHFCLRPDQRILFAF